MTEETKTEKTKAEKAEQAQAKARGDRGKVGTPSAGDTLNKMWKTTHFKRTDNGDWVRLPGAPSLKRFARDLVKTGDKVAKAWFANKKGAMNEKRSDKNRGRISLEAQASKASRKKKSQGKQPKATTDVAVVAPVKGSK